MIDAPIALDALMAMSIPYRYELSDDVAPFWLEMRGHAPMFCCAEWSGDFDNQKEQMTMGYPYTDFTDEFDMKDYGLKWRLWLTRPSKSVCVAAKWTDQYSKEFDGIYGGQADD